MTDRKLVVLCNDLPFPPNHGHKVDQYNRWLGFARAGWRLRLICWASPYDPPTTPADRKALEKVFEAVEVLPINHSPSALLRRLALLWAYPSHVSSRFPDRATIDRIQRDLSDFAPAAIVSDGIYAGALARRLATKCGVPLILRGHNVEHRYFAQQARLAKDLRSKLAWYVARLGLARWEFNIVANAAWTFQISADDMAFWQEKGFDRQSWAPTVYPDGNQITRLDPAQKRYDVAYIGNMRLPNNLEGLRWFVHEVLPLLRQVRPNLSLCFAGANPSEEAIALFATAPEIDLVPNARHVDDILSQGRVLINPILSGSGVNVKSIDMLQYDAPIVTTSVGVQGFPQVTRGQFVIDDSPTGFCDAIIAALDNPHPPVGRQASREEFSAIGLTRQMEAYSRVTKSSSG